MLKVTYELYGCRYGIHLWDVHHDGVWENRAIYVYYSELLFEISALSIDLCHHLHMLVSVLLLYKSICCCPFGRICRNGCYQFHAVKEMMFSQVYVCPLSGLHRKFSSGFCANHVPFRTTSVGKLFGPRKSWKSHG